MKFKILCFMLMLAVLTFFMFCGGNKTTTTSTATTATSATTSVASDATTTTTVKTVEKRYEGKPGADIYKAGLSRRLVLWQGEKGVFHLRTTTETLTINFRGKIVAEGGTITSISALKLEEGDWISLGKERKVIFFHFVTKKGIDGLSFTTDANKLHCLFDLKEEKKDWRGADPETEIFLGEKGIHPKHNPFELNLKTGEHNKSEHKEIGKMEAEKGNVIEVKEVMKEEEIEIEGREVKKVQKTELKRYEGQPTKEVYKAGLARRLVLWQGDKGVFHLRTTTAKLAISFRGKIIAEGGIFTWVNGLKLEEGDWVRITKDKKAIYFHFLTKKGIDGLNFTTDANKLHISFDIKEEKKDWKEANPETEIFLGSNGIHPKHNPFELDLKTGEHKKSEHKEISKREVEKEKGNVIEVKEIMKSDEIEIEAKE